MRSPGVEGLPGRVRDARRARRRQAQRARRVVVHPLHGHHALAQHVDPRLAVSLLGRAPPYHLVPQLGLLAERERIHHHYHFPATRLQECYTWRPNESQIYNLTSIRKILPVIPS